ncbi:hypothetical protein [Devosia submarina]|uniref:hypothetical protein n=1 Tax=Devosia submarina TaxID=1173082 RepID=UPI000D33ACFB|nr:hypothetical protein [Devosia submarina]
MFVVVRSVFWLTAAYLVIKPGVDLPDGNAVARLALDAGKQVVAEQVTAIQCTSFECIGGKAVAAAVLASPSVGAPIPPNNSVPVPRPRLDRAG